MALRINNNIAALTAQRYLGKSGNAMNVSLERLSSGMRINRAADNPAGLVTSEKQRAQIAGLNQAIENTERGVSMIQTAEASLSEVSSLLNKVRGLALDSANTAVNDAASLAANQREITDAVASIDRIATNAQFGSKKLLDGSNKNTISITDGGNTFDLTFGSSAIATGTDTVTISGFSAATYTTQNAATIGISSSPSTYGISGIKAGDHTVEVTQASTYGDLVGTVDITAAAFDIGSTDAVATGSVDVTAFALATGDTLTVSFSGVASSDLTILAGDNAATSAADQATAWNNAINNTAIYSTTVDGSKTVISVAAVGNNLVWTASGAGFDASIAITAEGIVDAGVNSVADYVGAGNDTAAGTDDTFSINVSGTGAETLTFAAADMGTGRTIAQFVTAINTAIDASTLYSTTGAGGKTIVSAKAGTGNVIELVTGNVAGTAYDEGSSASVTVTAVSMADSGVSSLTDVGFLSGNRTTTGTNAVVEIDGKANTVTSTGWAGTTAITLTDASSNSLSIQASATGLDAGTAILTVASATGSIGLSGAAAVAFTAGTETTLTDANGKTVKVTVGESISAGGSEGITAINNALVFQIGANNAQTVAMGLDDTSSDQLGLNVTNTSGFSSLSQIDVTTAQGAQDTLLLVDQAISDISTLRGNLGSFQANTLESNLNNLRVSAENLTAAESILRDTDFAAEMAEFTKNQILVQAGMTVLANATQIPQSVLSLLR